MQTRPIKTKRAWGATKRRRAMTVIATLACAVTSGAMATQDAGTAIELARSTLGRWVEMRRTISKERQDWTVAKELLQNQASLVRSEIEGVREKIAGAQASIGEADQAHADLLSKSEELVSASTTLAGVVAGLEARTKALLPRLPEPLRERVEPLSQRLPHEPSTTKLSLSERLANVVGIVNEANKFQREITLTSEVRELADGRSTEVATMYVGVSQAYFVSANGSISGSGHGAGSAWAWTRDDGAAQDILRALAIQRNEQVAGFVGLPMQVK